jgi:hypothetical protein
VVRGNGRSIESIIYAQAIRKGFIVEKMLPDHNQNICLNREDIEHMVESSIAQNNMIRANNGFSMIVEALRNM